MSCPPPPPLQQRWRFAPPPLRTPRCCCLSDAAAQFTWVEKEKAGSIRGTLSLQGAVREGSAGACKALERMSIRNFVLQRQDFTRAEKRFCQSACQSASSTTERP